MESLPGQMVPLVRNETLSQRAITLIRSAIVEGTLEPGSPLTVPAIAKLLGVSATPVREALMHLAEAGLVSFRDGRIVIASANESSLRQAFELREALEGMAARLAATRRTDDELAILKSHAVLGLDKARAGDAQGFRHHDMLFHRAVSQAAHSEQLDRYVGNALDLALTLRNIKRSETYFRAGAAHIHLEVTDAIERRDPDAAEAAMRSHVRAVLDQLLERHKTEAAADGQGG